MWPIITAYGLGLLTAGALAFSIRDLLKKSKDIDLLNANNYLHEENIRLRAQVALHINKDG